MQFSYKDCPSWFNNYIIETYLEEFHTRANFANSLKETITDPEHRDKLIDFAVDFFNHKGITAEKRDRQLWFDIDENDPKYFWIILKWSD